MYIYFDPMVTAANILVESTASSNDARREMNKIKLILEDSKSPITNKYLEKLYDSVVSKAHIDFGDIPRSKGNIVEYVGYTNMIEVLENILNLGNDNKSQSVIDYVNIVKESIRYMIRLAPLYQRGFKTNNDYVIAEYNTFVYTIVQATSALLYEFVDFMKKPNQPTMSIVLKNTKYKANSFYFEQLYRFNKINKTMRYDKYLEGILQNGRDNFTGVEMIGLGAIVVVALAIIPITRELVYQYYNAKSNLSDCLAQQAYFLEMNKAVIEANGDLNKKKKDEILIKQEKIKNLCLRLSDKLRVTHVKAISASKAAIQNDDKLLTLNGIKNEVNNSPLSLL